MSRKAFIATLEIQMVVLAETEEEAMELAEENMSEEVFNQLAKMEVEPLKYRPAGWDDNCIPYSHEREDITMAEVMDPQQGYFWE